MSNTKVANSTNQLSGISQKINDYKMLVKVRLSMLVVFSAVMAFLIASTGAINWAAVGILALGGFLVTGASNALNQVLEKNFDSLMKRTANRPIPSGRMTSSEAVLAAGFMSLFGIVLLALFNPWTALLGTISLIIYAFVYTPMKRVSPIAVFVGAIPGALPMMIGCVAFEGELTALALVLFGIQFFWQFPHFWAIAWVGHEDYTNAGYRLIPSKDGKLDSNTGRQSFIYALMLIPVSIAPYFMGITGIVSAIILAVLGIAYAYFGWDLYKKCTKEAALKLMFSSFFYLPIALIVLWLDKI